MPAFRSYECHFQSSNKTPKARRRSHPHHGIVVAVQGTSLGIQRTWVRPAGRDRWRTAPYKHLLQQSDLPHPLALRAGGAADFPNSCEGLFLQASFQEASEEQTSRPVRVLKKSNSTRRPRAKWPQAKCL